MQFFGRIQRLLDGSTVVVGEDFETQEWEWEESFP